MIWISELNHSLYKFLLTISAFKFPCFICKIYKMSKVRRIKSWQWTLYISLLKLKLWLGSKRTPFDAHHWWLWRNWGWKRQNLSLDMMILKTSKGPFTLRVLLFFCLIKHFFGRFQTLYLFDHTLVFEFDLHKTVKQKNKKTVKHFSDILHMKQYSPDFVW